MHFGNDPEDPVHVGELLDRYPNLYVDTAARVPEIGRGDVSKVRELFLRHRKRILFGTDLAVGESLDQLWLGSRGREVPTEADVTRFFSSTFRFFETGDKGFDSPTPIQGDWTVSGLQFQVNEATAISGDPQLGDGRVHGVEMGRPLFRGEAGEMRFPDDPPRHHVHHVEGRADDALVVAATCRTA